MRRAFLAGALLTGLTACAGQGACAGPFALIVASGQFADRTTFSPNGTGFVVLDNRREVRHPDGSVTLEERGEPRVVVVLVATQFDPEVDLAAMPLADQEDLLGALRVADMLVIQDLAASRVAAGTALKSSVPSTSEDTFTFLLQRPTVSTATNQELEGAPAIGTLRTVTLDVSQVNLRALGRMAFNVRLDAQEGPSQEDGLNPSTGTVQVNANLPIIQERVGRSNVAFIKRALTPR